MRRANPGSITEQVMQNRYTSVRQASSAKRTRTAGASAAKSTKKTTVVTQEKQQFAVELQEAEGQDGTLNLRVG